jgi:hypothetical protein
MHCRTLTHAGWWLELHRHLERFAQRRHATRRFYMLLAMFASSIFRVRILLELDADWSADVSNFENMFVFACGCILDPKNIWFLEFDWLMRVFGTSSERSPTACSLFGAVMRQFEFNSRRIHDENA